MPDGVSRAGEFDARAPFRQLLLINEYPPSTIAGAPVIARQLFRHYDPQRMDVLCCETWHESAIPKVRETFLPCRHTLVPSLRTNLRPRRFFHRVDATLDLLRLPLIQRAGRRIIRERGVEAIFSISYGPEFPHAAYFLAREFGLPFYYFESDRLDTLFASPLTKWLIQRHRLPFLRSLKKLWLTSPKMIREFRELYGVDGEYLFHFLDVESCLEVVRKAPPLPSDRIHIVYTGSINSMFYDTMRWFCDWLNRGLEIDGRPVEMTIYSSSHHPEFGGRRVRMAGLVKLEEIPSKLAEAHIAGVFVSFTQDRGIRDQIETSLYTKTVDYLAAERPVLVISPDYAAEVDCFRDVTCVVDRMDQDATVAAIRRLVSDEPYVSGLRERGLEMVRRAHSLEALEANFLSHFRRETPAAAV